MARLWSEDSAVTVIVFASLDIASIENVIVPLELRHSEHGNFQTQIYNYIRHRNFKANIPPSEEI